MKLKKPMETYTARVLALLSSTQHMIHDASRSSITIGIRALFVIPDLYSHLLHNFQNISRITSKLHQNNINKTSKSI
jgi:hypothetical protein